MGAGRSASRSTEPSLRSFATPCPCIRLRVQSNAILHASAIPTYRDMDILSHCRPQNHHLWVGHAGGCMPQAEVLTMRHRISPITVIGPSGRKRYVCTQQHTEQMAPASRSAIALIRLETMKHTSPSQPSPASTGLRHHRLRILTGSVCLLLPPLIQATICLIRPAQPNWSRVLAAETVVAVLVYHSHVRQRMRQRHRHLLGLHSKNEGKHGTK